MLYPFAPFTAAEMYDNASVSEGKDVRSASWPEVTESKERCNHCSAEEWQKSWNPQH